MTHDVKLSLIVARGRNGVIGNKGALPWRLKTDLAFFKEKTIGHPIVMGRKTWESLPRQPLPGRENIVLTRDWTYDAPGARVYSSFAAAANAAKAIALKDGKDEVFVVGGEAIYTMALAVADRIYLTDVMAEPEGDAFFPFIPEDSWNQSDVRAVSQSERDDHDFVIRTLDRIYADATPN